jgi:hypothetical protein
LGVCFEDIKTSEGKRRMEQASNAVTPPMKSANHRQQGTIFTLIALTLLAIAISILIYITLSSSMYRVPSLRGKWGLFAEKAHEWKSDSYLTEVRIDVNGQVTYQMLAIYNSPTAREALSIAIENSGEITVMPFGTGGTLRPILRESWVIDSQRALDLFSKYEHINVYLQSPSEHPIFLDLVAYNSEYAMWGLEIFTFSESGDFTPKRFYMNAKTGEIFDPY